MRREPGLAMPPGNGCRQFGLRGYQIERVGIEHQGQIGRHTVLQDAKRVARFAQARPAGNHTGRGAVAKCFSRGAQHQFKVQWIQRWACFIEQPQNHLASA